MQRSAELASATARPQDAGVAGCRTIGDAELFVMNWDVPDSVDSRYFGPFPRGSVIGRALPVFTDEAGDGRFQWWAATR